MTGLMNAGKQADSLPATGEEESNVTPEEQAQYDEFVANGMNLIYDEKGLQQTLESLEGDGSPIEGLASTLIGVVSRLEDSAEEAGTPISGDVVYHGGVELLEQLAEMSSKAKLHDYSEEDMESALFMALDQYRQMRQQQGKLPEDELKADFNSILQAEQAGNLDQALPGIEEYAARASQQQG